MSGPDTETLTAALRRLSDEHASGLLSVATPGRDVVVELEDGVPIAIGPAHDVSDRVGPEADGALVSVAVVDELVDRMVAAIVRGGGDWAWDVSSDDERLPVPAGLVEELARRAVDAAQALADLAPEDVLSQGHDVDTSGELDRVRALFDGERTVADVAVAAGLTVPAVATMAAALVGAGALATDDDDPAAEPVSWSDAVRASEVDDEDDDEPELWVMEPAEDEDLEDEWPDDRDASPDEPSRLDDDLEDEPVAPAAASTPVFSDVGTAEETDGVVDDTLTFTEPEPEPEPEDAAALQDEPAPAAAAGEWNDTTWLDELAPQDSGADAPPVLAAGDDEPADPRAALSSMLNDLQQDDSPRSAPPAEEPPTPSEKPGDAGDQKTVATERREPKAEPGEVAEFLRELSRLALDDD